MVVVKGKVNIEEIRKVALSIVKELQKGGI